jgi:hypothetical protein
VSIDANMGVRGGRGVNKKAIKTEIGGPLQIFLKALTLSLSPYGFWQNLKLKILHSCASMNVSQAFDATL